MGGGRPQEAQPPALMTDSMYIIYILPCNFPGIRAKNVGIGGVSVQ